MTTFEQQLLKLQEEENIEEKKQVNVKESDIMELLRDINKLLQDVTQTMLNKKTILLEEAYEIGQIEMECIGQFNTMLSIMKNRL